MFEAETTLLAGLTTAQKQLTEQIDAAKADFIAKLKEVDLGSYKSDLGSFTIGKRTSWEYNSDVKVKIDALKTKIVVIEEKARFEGQATEKTSEYLTVRV